jgi:hypothetical protein
MSIDLDPPKPFRITSNGTLLYDNAGFAYCSSKNVARTVFAQQLDLDEWIAPIASSNNLARGCDEMEIVASTCHDNSTQADGDPSPNSTLGDSGSSISLSVPTPTGAARQLSIRWQVVASGMMVCSGLAVLL